MVRIRFERGCEDRWSSVYGPFEFVQLTYSSLRVGPDGDFFAQFVEGDWILEADADKYGVDAETIRQSWSDIVIFAAE